MVAFDPNKFKSIEDFGWGDSRGDLRGDLIADGYYIGDQFTSFSSNPWDGFAEDRQVGTGPYYQDADGKWQQFNSGYDPSTGRRIDEWKRYSDSLADGTLLHSGYMDEYGSFQSTKELGAFRNASEEQRLKDIIVQDGSYKTGNKGYHDFMSSQQLVDASKKGDEKWSKDYAYEESIAPLLNDPNWVQRDESGNITNIRAELYPYLMRQALGDEYSGMSRGGTKRSGGFGDVVKGLVLGVATGGLGLAGAGALGLASGSLASGLTAGAISGGLSSALTGGDVLKGALTGGVTGGLTKFASPYVGSGLNNMGVTNPLLNKTLTGGIIGSGVSAVKGGNAGTGFLTGATNALGQQLGNQVFGSDKSFVKDLAVNAGTGAVNSAITGRKYDPSSLINGKNLMSFADWVSSQNG
jgi:uncharacterized membrane protein YoaK (UPF0700 family)